MKVLISAPNIIVVGISINNCIICIFAQFGLEKILMKKSFLPTTFSVADERGYSMYYFQTNKDTWYRPDLDEVDN